MGLRPTLMKRLERAEKTGVVVLADLRLEKVPPQVWDAGAKVRSLALPNNRLESLPPDIGRLPNVKLLNLSANRLVRLAPELSLLASLTTLDLACNLLEAVPRALWEMPNLVTLNMRQNRLTSLACAPAAAAPDGVGCGGGGGGDDLPLPEFASARSLKRLDVSQNLLTRLPGRMFANCSALEELDADQNRLECLPEELGAGELKSLRIIKVRKNKLASFPPGIFTRTPVSAIYIQDNPLRVDDLRRMDGYDDFEIRRKGRVDQLLNV